MADTTSSSSSRPALAGKDTADPQPGPGPADAAAQAKAATAAVQQPAADAPTAVTAAMPAPPPNQLPPDPPPPAGQAAGAEWLVADEPLFVHNPDAGTAPVRAHNPGDLVAAAAADRYGWRGKTHVPEWASATPAPAPGQSEERK